MLCLPGLTLALPNLFPNPTEPPGCIAIGFLYVDQRNSGGGHRTSPIGSHGGFLLAVLGCRVAQELLSLRARAMVCFMALIVYRVMRQRLALAKSDLTPEKALAQLRRIQRHSVRINQAEPITGISTINDIQALVLQTLNIKKPTHDAQLTLL